MFNEWPGTCEAQTTIVMVISIKSNKCILYNSVLSAYLYYYYYYYVWNGSEELIIAYFGGDLCGFFIHVSFVKRWMLTIANSIHMETNHFRKINGYFRYIDFYFQVNNKLLYLQLEIVFNKNVSTLFAQFGNINKLSRIVFESRVWALIGITQHLSTKLQTCFIASLRAPIQ